jgi:hypothetical protein
MRDPCACAVELTGLIELAHPSCDTHWEQTPACPLHGGEWAIYQCIETHDESEVALYEEIIRIRQQAIELAWEAATIVALWGSCYFEVTHKFGQPNEVKVIRPDQIMKKV